MYIPLNLPAGKYQEWVLENFQKEGKWYQRLRKGKLLMMANTPEIVAEYVDFLNAAQGAVHINGLGIGLCCQYLLSKPAITQITVLETEPAIVKLVAPYFTHDSRCTILLADAYTYQPPIGTVYDFVWHDIWTYQAAINVAQMKQLFKHYQPYAKQQDAWSQAHCELLQQQEKEWMIY